MAGALGKRFFKMLINNIDTDTTFVVEETEIRCHKLVISSIGGPLAQLVAKEGNRIIIDNMSLRVFGKIIRYLYTGDCKISSGNFFELMYASKEFNLHDLQLRCVKFGIGRLTCKNILAYTQQALDFDSKEFLCVCQEYCKAKAKEIFKQPAFLDISHEVLKMLCTLEGINCTVLELFAACLGWAEKKCKCRKLEVSPDGIITVLGNILDVIKFEEMTMEDFIEFVVPEGVLTNEKVGQLINGWQKDKKNNQWKKSVKVTIYEPSAGHSTKACLPLHNRIRDVKKLKLFEGGKSQGSAEKFTVGYRNSTGSYIYQPLPDVTSLSSICNEGEEVIDLNVNEIKCTVTDSMSRWKLPVSVTLDDLLGNFLNQVIRHRMYIHDTACRHNPEYADIIQPWPLIPGSIFIVKEETRF